MLVGKSKKCFYSVMGWGGILLVSSLAKADWLDDVSATQAEQPHWVTPLVTVTPRLEQEYRVDMLQTQLKTGALLDNYGNGKGLELVAGGLPLEVALSAPAYMEHPGHNASDGYADSSFLLKYRLLAANESSGNYIVTAFLGGSLPTGSANSGNQAAIYTPTLAVGKGQGIVDVQSTLAYSLPANAVNRLGHTLLWNTALQVHLGAFWPEIEYNQTQWRGGAFSGERMGLATAGCIWRQPLWHRVGLVLGLAYQRPVTAFQTQKHTWLATARLPF